MSDECGVSVVLVEKEADESLSAVAAFERLPLAALLSFHNSQHWSVLFLNTQKNKQSSADMSLARQVGRRSAEFPEG